MEPEKVTPASDVVIGCGELWLPAKELHEVMMEIIKDTNPPDQLVQDIDRLLTRHAGDFSSIFAIKPPSPVDREELQKCSTEGRYLKGFRGKQVLSYAIVNESIMLSDMFQINEFLALDLLTIADAEIDNYPNWPRGLIAVHMFYEGRFWLIQTLATMIRCTPGRQWRSSFDTQILTSFRRVLNSVYREYMMDRFITLLETFSMEKQLEILEANLALGDTRHRRKIRNLLHCIKDALAHTIFCYSAQRSLRWAELSRILDYLKEQIHPEDSQVTRGDATLIATVLYTIETTLCPEEPDMTFGQSLKKYLVDNQNNGFKCMEVWDVIKLSFHIAASKLNGSGGKADDVVGLGPTSPRAGPFGDSVFGGESTPISRGGATDETARSMLGCDPAEFDFARNLFGFLQAEIFAHPTNYTWDQDITKVYHGFLVDFIVHMQVKLKEIKYRSEETAKTILLCQEQGVNPPVTEVAEYESFLDCLGEFYQHDPYELGRYYFMEDSQFLPLAKLVRTSCMETPSLFVSAIRFLTGLTTGNPRAMFNILRENGHNTSLEHFFESILKYMQTFSVVGFDGQNFQSAAERERLMSVHANLNLVMNPLEIQGICSYLKLVETVCERYEPARSFFSSQKPNWIRTILQVVKIRKIPREIRASMLDTCAAMIGNEPLSPEVVTTLWDIFYALRLIDPGTGDVKEELEEKETRLEEYSLTIGMLRLFKSLVNIRFRQMEFVSLEGYFVHPTYDNGAIFPYINYITDAVFIKTPYRLFKDANQRWTITKLCTDILSILLDFLPKLMIQLLCDSPLIRTVLSAVVDCIIGAELSSEADETLKENIDNCSLSLLMLLWRALQRQQFYIMQKREIMESQDIVLLLGIHKVMMSATTDGGAPEYILSLIRYIDTMSYSPKHIKAALEILSIVLEDNTEIDHQIHHALVWQEGLGSVFKHMVVEVLYQGGWNEQDETSQLLTSVKLSALKLLRTSVVHLDPNLGMFLLGYNSKRKDYYGSRTVLHGLTDNAALIPTSFKTILTLLCDPRLSTPTLKFLRYCKFFHGHLSEPGILQQLTMEGLSYFLKCLAIELKSEECVVSIATELFPLVSKRLEEILHVIEMENHSLELPDLEFFDGGLVMQALTQCEYVDKELKTRLIRVEMLDGMLKDEITKLEKSTVLHLRKTVHTEAKDVLEFARSLNELRKKEGCKLLVFDGWRQVTEVIALTPQIRSPEFCPHMIRLLLTKVLETKGTTDFFLRLAAETALTLSAVISLQETAGFLTSSTVNVIIANFCKWLASATNVKVRGILYSGLLYCVNVLESMSSSTGQFSDILPSLQNSFPLILDNLCRDCCQGSGEITRMQALYLMGEIIRCTTFRGMSAASTGSRLGSSFVEDSFLNTSRGLDQTADNPAAFDDSFSDGNVVTTSTRLRQSLSSTTGAGGRTPNTPRQKLQESKAGSITNLSWVGSQHSRGGQPLQLKSSSTEIIMNCVYTNGFLSTIVESLCVVDDLDLMSLLGTDQSDTSNVMAMRSFFVFEAKLSMLSRLAGTGLKAVIHLMDLNLVKRLTDMRVFELQSYQQHDTGLLEGTRGQGSTFQDGLATPSGITRSSEMNQSINMSHYTISESLYVQVLKLFHVMLDSASKNIQVLCEIMQFLSVHDSSLSKILSHGRLVQKDNPRTAPQLFTSLMAKIAGNQQRVRSGVQVFPQQNNLIKPALLSVIRIQAERNNTKGDEVGIRLVKQILLFLFYSFKPVDEEPSISTSASTKKLKTAGNKVLTNKLELDTLLRNQDEDVSLGVIMHCVVHAASAITDGQIKSSTSKKGSVPVAMSGSLILTEKTMQDLVVIVEVGLSLIYFHLEIFLQELRLESKQHSITKATLEQYTEQVTAVVEGMLSKKIQEACKKIEDKEYIETMLLKIRRIASVAGAGSRTTT